jgi:hypothetical protein
MKKLILTAVLSIAAGVAITACAVQQPVDINKMSLEKTSPFETPTPKAYGENAGLYRETQMGMPAMIPHAINNFKITREHGQFFEKDGIQMMALYHPAALLRDPHKKPETFEDLKRLQAKIREICDHTPLDF